jgi:hypothetical protein
LFTFWVTAAWIGIARGPARARGGLAPLALGALALGIASLVRPTVQYLPLLLAPALWWWDRRGDGARRALVLVAGFALAFAPWVVRNEVVVGGGDPTLTISALHHGAYPEFEYQGRPETFGFPYRYDPDDAVAMQSVGNAVAHIVRGFREEPGHMLRWYLFEKPVYLFRWDPIQGAGDVFVYPVSASPYFDRSLFRVTRFLMWVLHWPLMAAGFLGALAVWHPRFVAAARLDERAVRGWRALSLVVLYVIAVHVVGAPFPRYSVPFRPLTYLFAVLLAVDAMRRFRRA